MARVTVEDCLEREENRFALVVLAASRTRQLMKGAEPLVRTKNKPAVAPSESTRYKAIRTMFLLTTTATANAQASAPNSRKKNDGQ